MKFAFTQWMQNVSLWKATNDIDKTFFGEISSFALLTTERWIKSGVDPVTVRVQTITKEAPVAPADFGSLFYLRVLGVQQTGNIASDIYATPEYEKLVEALRKQNVAPTQPEN